MNSMTYGRPDGPVYLDIKSSEEAAAIFINFIRDVLGNVLFSPSYGEASEYQKIKLALVKYNAVYRFNQAKDGYIRRHVIRFATPKDLTAFMLRYA